MCPARTVLITGCSVGGIGHALAEEFHAKGLQVIATARRMDAMEQLAKKGIETLELDVTNAESIRKVHGRVAEMTYGRLDILVNNAEVKAVFEVNLFAVMAMVQAFSGLLVASGDGRIVNIGSIAGVMPYPFGSVYNASKAALHAYGDTLRLELAPLGIKVITIVTGGVASNIANNPRYILPSSMYEPISEIYAERRARRSQQGALPTSTYAQRVVAQTLKRSPVAWFWTGSFSRICWFLSTFGSRRAFDWLFSWNFGLNILRDKVGKKSR
ncbi:NAD-P-binding protein [Rickenella mellea]|uniref:NAD-P-binding protein n=1 Tax=Rickenella mellea TaxID=50990 RepID=A0A4Y7Q6X9_9AGAM|nr:NAD-P-binding protein [Rickenella mellea]